MHPSDMIVVDGLHKSYKDLQVLNGISFSVRRGTILALLGPNGAGKTTTIRILSTLLLPSGGRATINGFDVVEEADKVRETIGLTGQYTAVDEYLTGAENLYMMGRLYHMDKGEIRRKAAELLDALDLADAAKRPVRTYSGGMRRRLDLAASLIASPPVIFLDEPTTGLDPPSRIEIWDMIERLAKEGTTILLTTQYMDEADRLAHDIVVIDGGKVIAEGTPHELKRRIGSERMELVFPKGIDLQKAKAAIGMRGAQVDLNKRTLTITTKGGVHELKQAMASLERAKIEAENISLHKPTLDDVFLTLTGHLATQEEKGGKK